MSDVFPSAWEAPAIISACRGAGAQGAFLNFDRQDTAQVEQSTTIGAALQQWLSAQGFASDNLNARYANQTTPLMQAARLGDVEMINALLLAGADFTPRNADGNNALWLACFSDNLDALQALLIAGIDLNNRNDNGSTCLMYAASASKPAVVSVLLQAGADISLENLDGFTALDMAASLECLNLLRAARSSPATHVSTNQAVA